MIQKNDFINENLTEADRVRLEAEKKKAAARDKKADQLVKELYFNFIQYLPEFPGDTTYNKIGPRVSSFLTKVSKKTIDSVCFIEIVLNKKSYTFSFTESSSYSPAGYFTSGDLVLFYNDRKVFGIHLDLDLEEHSSYCEWKIIGISAFIDGVWIEDLRHLQKKHDEDKNESDIIINKTTELKEIEKLKHDFDIN